MVANRSIGTGVVDRVVGFLPEPPPVAGDQETARSWSWRQFRALSLELDKVQRGLGEGRSQDAALALIAADLAARLAVVETETADLAARLAVVETETADLAARLAVVEADEWDR